jgi:hypothetical protein
VTSPKEETAPLSPLTDPDNVKLDIVPDDELPGTGLTPEQAWSVLEADPSTYGKMEE